MKKAKKLASLLLALVMALALAVPAMAEGGTGTITLDNPKEGVTYTAYKIFDVVYNSDKSAYSYTIKNATGTWFSDVLLYMGSTWTPATETEPGKYTGNPATADADGIYTGNGITLTPTANDPTLYVVAVTDGEFSAADFARFLNTKTNGKTGQELTGTADGPVTASGLDLGYYFVSSGSGALCNLTTTNPTANIHDKNDMPFEKEDNKADVEIGEVVNYTITGKVPDTTGFDVYTYKITDTMSAGLTFQKDVKVEIGGEDKTSDCTITNNDTGFELTIPVKNYQTQIGAAITVTYTAIVNENAVAVISQNSATLTYSNDPNDSTETTTTPPEEETVYSAKIDIVKHKTGDENTKLAGAEFVLYKEVIAAGATEATKMYYKYTAATETEKAKVEWVANIGEATVAPTGENGAAGFKGLKNGTYYLLETKAPAGYNLLTEPKEITIAGSDTDAGSLTCTAKVANNTGVELPSTGGMGTTIFYAAGSVLVLAAVVLLVTKKRMKSAK